VRQRIRNRQENCQTKVTLRLQKKHTLFERQYYSINPIFLSINVSMMVKRFGGQLTVICFFNWRKADHICLGWFCQKSLLCRRSQKRAFFNIFVFIWNDVVNKEHQKYDFLTTTMHNFLFWILWKFVWSEKKRFTRNGLFGLHDVGRNGRPSPNCWTSNTFDTLVKESRSGVNQEDYRNTQIKFQAEPIRQLFVWTRYRNVVHCIAINSKAAVKLTGWQGCETPSLQAS